MKGYIRSAIVASCALLVLVCAASATTTIEPITVSNRALGGADLNAYTLGVFGGRGANNIGLLVRTWGKVTYVNTVEEYFYVDDGARLSTTLPDDTVVLGVRVSYGGLATGVPAITPPTVNQTVAITGISSTVVIGGNTYPNLRARKGADIVSFL